MGRLYIYRSMNGWFLLHKCREIMVNIYQSHGFNWWILYGTLVGFLHSYHQPNWVFGNGRFGTKLSQNLVGATPAHLVFESFNWWYINWWFGARWVWIPRIPLWKGLFLRSIPRIPNHRAPKHQYIPISWNHLLRNQKLVTNSRIPKARYITLLRETHIAPEKLPSQK